MTRIYFDTEFTGLHKDTTLVSIGMISDTGETFYAELSDYAKLQVDDWLKCNVIDKLEYKDYTTYFKNHDGQKLGSFIVKDNTEVVERKLRIWLSQYDKVEMWSDCLAYDWVLFCNIFGHAFKIPDNVYYIPMDLSTAFKMRGIDPDINREKFAGLDSCEGKHNALWDAKVIKACVEKLDIK